MRHEPMPTVLIVLRERRAPPGAWDALKPTVVLARLATELQAQQACDWLRDHNEALKTEVARRMVENDLTQRVAIRALAHLAETHDPETGNHILRTQACVRRLALGLRGHTRFALTASDRYVELLTHSAPLHDIGKVAIPDHILLKPGKLTADEWTVMQTHARRDSEAIVQGSGAHFDPAVVDAFVAAFSDFEAIAGRYSDAG